MASTALASPALARDNSWYIGAEFGPMLAEDLDLAVRDADGNEISIVSLDTDYGFDGGGYVGYDFGAFRLEAEASYRDASVDNISVGQGGLTWGGGNIAAAGDYPAAGGIDSLSFMLNGLFDFGSDDGLQFYAGAGIGVARTSVEGRVVQTGPASIDDSSSDIAWQLLAGINAPLTDNVDVGLRYRMFTAEDVELVDLGGRSLDEKWRTHSIMGTLTYNFGAPTPPPPPPPPPPDPWG